MNIKPEMRIGDAERSDAVAALGEHYATGRLTREEYDERSALAWEAQTYADLRPLFGDLPAPGGAQAQSARAQSVPPWQQPRSPRTAPRRPSRDHGFRFPWLPMILLVIGLSFLLPGPWWLLLLGAFFFSKTFRHGCGGHPRRS